ncbi:MAG: hypothetical protein AB8B97_06940 [Granulosicoccus sp.]
MKQAGDSSFFRLALALPERCRPGLRYGIAPQRSIAESMSESIVKRMIGRMLAKYRLLSEKFLTKRYNARLVSCIDELTGLSDKDFQTSLSVLRQQVTSEGYNRESYLFALAHACVAAETTLALKPREGQRRAATGLLFGLFVEMPTGEGKTLATALAAAVIALDGSPVHVLTANDYLAERDATLLAPLYFAFGLSSSFVRPDMSESERSAAYACDVTHLTGKQAGFDWMRDALVNGPDSSALVTQLGSLANPRIRGIKNSLQRGLCVGILDEADCMLLDEARTPLVLASPTIAGADIENEASIALALAQLLSPDSDFQLRHHTREATLTEMGIEALENYVKKVPGAWRATRYRNERVRQALIVLHLYQCDHDYVVRDGKVMLVDEQSGRALPDRRLQHGLHNLLALKENCEATPENQTVASIAFQSFFLRYVRLVGTSGTLAEVRGELTRTYGASMIRVPAAKPLCLTRFPTRILVSHAEQLEVLIEEVRYAKDTKRPVLIATRSVEQSRAVSAMLSAYNFEHRILDASQNRDEAEIIAVAGQQSCVTVATNMAGRGTDIPLGNGVAELGGLHLVSLAFNDARRIDRQLLGRTARQGAPGSFRQLWALDDVALKSLYPKILCRYAVASSTGGECSGVARLLLLFAIRSTQRRIEWRHSSQRRASLSTQKEIARNTALNGFHEHPA